MSDERPNVVNRRSGEVSLLGLRVLQILDSHTRFPWPLLKSQCQQKGFDPAALDADQVRAMLDDLLDGLAKLTDPQVAARARADLDALLEG